MKRTLYSLTNANTAGGGSSITPRTDGNCLYFARGSSITATVTITVTISAVSEDFVLIRGDTIDLSAIDSSATFKIKWSAQAGEWAEVVSLYQEELDNFRTPEKLDGALIFTTSGGAGDNAFAAIGDEVVLAGRSRLALQISNGGPNTLTGFAIQVLAHPAGTWTDYLADADFAATDIDALKFASANPHELASSALAVVIVELIGVYAIRFRAKVGSGHTATVTVRGQVE